MIQIKKIFSGMIAIGISNISYGVEIKKNDDSLSEWIAIDNDCKDNGENAKAEAKKHCESENSGMVASIVSIAKEHQQVSYSYKANGKKDEHVLKSPMTCSVYFNCGSSENEPTVVEGDFFL